ncbi:hypothetical protein BRADI_3g23306v3 [Brachypodium distachyon]|uniref:Uncharacterized protein n=1 Tax=Brachypodium distachyon TaxID=15368 RepID=A0A2K2CZ24_BRADI|nr:hypothetical protein BRADI_3g23306v3 [Brachypodium distachyon]
MVAQPALLQPRGPRPTCPPCRHARSAGTDPALCACDGSDVPRLYISFSSLQSGRLYAPHPPSPTAIVFPSSSVLCGASAPGLPPGFLFAVRSCCFPPPVSHVLSRTFACVRLGCCRRAVRVCSSLGPAGNRVFFAACLL